MTRRLAVMSSGPVALGRFDETTHRRLEAAGVPIVHADADVAEVGTLAWPGLPELRRLACGFGSPRARLLLVGDRTTARAVAPFASRSGTWLYNALRSLGWDELDLYVANARDLDGARRPDRLRALVAALPHLERVVALGREAENVCRAAEIVHGYAPHPAHARRWKYEEGSDGYAAALVSAGVQRRGEDPTTGYRAAWGVDRLPEIPGRHHEAVHVASCAYARAKKAEGKRQRRGSAEGPEPAKLEACRTMYVSRNADSVAAAAQTMGVSVARAQEAARAQGWAEQRAEHARQAAEQALKASAEREARALAAARGLAWDSVVTGMKSVRDRLKLPKEDERHLAPTPNQVEALARTALMLSGAEIDAALAPRQAEVDALDLGSLLEAARDELAKIQGEAP